MPLLFKCLIETSATRLKIQLTLLSENACKRLRNFDFCFDRHQEICTRPIMWTTFELFLMILTPTNRNAVEKATHTQR